MIIAHHSRPVGRHRDPLCTGSRDAALAESQLPSVVMTPLLDDPDENNGSICWMNWNLTLAVDILTGAGKDSAASL